MSFVADEQKGRHCIILLCCLQVELQFRKSDQTLRNVEGKSKEVIIVLREQLVAANDEKVSYGIKYT